MIFSLVTNEAGLNAVAGIATVLCLVGLLIVWADYSVAKEKKRLKNADNRGNLKTKNSSNLES